MLFDEKPSWFIVRHAIQVALCLVTVQSQLLLLRRHPNTAERQAGKWGMPGGTLEEHEPLDCMWRELWEETGIWLQNKADLGEALVRYTRHIDADGVGKVDFTFYLFRLSLPRRPAITLNRKEHTAYRWVTLHEVLRMQLVRDQIEFLRLWYPGLA